eukprot:364950-Chlamydomonas_euryale.AAC.7
MDENGDHRVCSTVSSITTLPSDGRNGSSRFFEAVSNSLASCSAATRSANSLSGARGSGTGAAHHGRPGRAPATMAANAAAMASPARARSLPGAAACHGMGPPSAGAPAGGPDAAASPHLICTTSPSAASTVYTRLAPSSQRQSLVWVLCTTTLKDSSAPVGTATVPDHTFPTPHVSAMPSAGFHAPSLTSSPTSCEGLWHGMRAGS